VQHELNPWPGQPIVKRGRPPVGERTQTNAELKRKYRAVKRESRLQHLAVLDMETDPFENDRQEIHPFCAELYSDQFGSIVIWDENYESLIEKIYAEIEALPDAYTIYAHNGGKFDFMFFVHKLRGTVRFKGRAIMSAKIGSHELRDSLHILPEKLAAWKKDKFDYSKMLKCNRRKFRDEILTYLHSDCVYLFDFIKRFTKEFGLKISIGQAAFAELKKHYRIAPIKETMDTALRPYFLGGRVECIAGKGVFYSDKQRNPYKLYDVNSMYPHVMASCKHPITGNYVWHRGQPNDNTFFIDLNCKSYGAFFQRQENGDLSADECEGRFQTTIWEYNTALKYDLIENVKINWCIDNSDCTTFADFVVPMYLRRQETKAQMEILRKTGKEQTPEYEELKKENIFLKYLLNNAYGKCAQNPRKYKEYHYTDHDTKPPKEWFEFLIGADDELQHEYGMPIERCDLFDVWARPAPGSRYNNVGTAASITGAARAILLEAKQNAIDPIYCDTDSLICRDLKAPLSETLLGAWKIEDTFDSIVIIGKKTYCCAVSGKPDCAEGRLKVRSKGVDLRVRPLRSGFEAADPTEAEWRIANEATWDRYLKILDDETITVTNKAPTFNKLGQQEYLTRRIRATALLKPRVFGHATRIAQIRSR
jgi:hypothetical protein